VVQSLCKVGSWGEENKAEISAASNSGRERGNAHMQAKIAVVISEE